LLETGLREPGRDSTSILPLSAYDLEHIMPKDWKEYWPLNEDTVDNQTDRKYHIGLLGNKTLLAKGLNKSLKNKGYLEKRTGTNNNSGYNKYAVGLKTFDFQAYEKWDEKTIEKRLNTIIEQIKVVWPYGTYR